MSKTFPIASSALTPSCDISFTHGLAVFLFTNPDDGTVNSGKEIKLCWDCALDHELIGGPGPKIPKMMIAHPMGCAA